MTLEEAKAAIEAVEEKLGDDLLIDVHTFTRDGRTLTVALTERARRLARKDRVWKSKAYLTAFKNAEYGFDERQAFSAGGEDGIFVLTRNHKPPNLMMRKIFERFLDKPDDLALEIAAVFSVSCAELTAARLVSHHLRLLGILHREADGDRLIIVDHDVRK